MIDLIATGEAARLLQVHPQTLRKWETPDHQWCVVFGYTYRFRVYNYGGGLNPTRRYDRNELLRIIAQLDKAT